MAFRTLSLAGAAIAAAFLVPNVSAQGYDGARLAYSGQAYANAGPARDRYGYPRAGASRDVRYDLDRPPPRRAEYRDRRARRCGQGDVGTLLGAIAGGLLGNAQASRHGGHAAGAGMLAGNAAGRDCD